MKYTVFFLMMLFCASGYSDAQTTAEIPVKFRTTAPLSKVYTLTVGVDSRATDCLDTALDEVDLPPPPPDFFPILLPGCTDTNSGTTITLQRDYRYLPPGSFEYIYNIKLLRGPDMEDVIIQWNKELPEHIDSAFLLIEFVDTLDMAAQEQFIITNDFIRAMQIRVHYSFPTVSVEETSSYNEQAWLFPHPVEETASLSTGEYKGGIYELYTATGERIQAGDITYEDSMPLSFGKLASGVYVLYTKTISGKSSFRPFVKK